MIVVLSAASCAHRQDAREVYSLGAGSPISSAPQATELSLEMLPEGFEPEEYLVGKTNIETLTRQWFRAGSNPDWNPSTEVWLVALTKSGVTRDEIIEPPPFGGFSEADATGYQSPNAGGAYFVWEQESGLLLARGVLAPNERRNSWNHIESVRGISFAESWSDLSQITGSRD